MPIRAAVSVAVLLATQFATLSAQRSGDRARLVFTISGALIDGKGLWTVPNQPLDVDGFPATLTLNRSIQTTFGAALAGTYYPRDKVGLTAEAFFMALGYEDACRSSGGSFRLMEACQYIDQEETSAAAAAFSVGGIFRIASRESISPFVRAGAGLMISNQSSVRTEGFIPSEGNALLIVYADDSRTRVKPALTLGVGATMVLSRGYHLRWEVRDNIMGFESVTGPVAAASLIPPHETEYKHLWSVLIGLDIILERQRGRRY